MGDARIGRADAGVPSPVPPKRLELLSQAAPRATLVGVLAFSPHPLKQQMVQAMELAARTLRRQLVVVEAADAAEIDRGFETLGRRGARALAVLSSPIFFLERKRIADLAIKGRLPTVFEGVKFAEVGGLMAYAASNVEISRRAATYVDKILKGAKPADLPIEQPTKFELVINVKTAKALGLTIPPVLLGRADRIIE